MHNRRFLLAARPVGLPKASDFKLAEETVREPADGEVVVKVGYISLDPAMRGWMNDARSYAPPIQIGEVIRALAIGEVVTSRAAGFSTGDLVSGLLGIQEVAVMPAAHLTRMPRTAPPPVLLGALGMPGLTAYFGLLDLGKPKAGDTVVVSGAAGAVGSVACQIARIQGCRVIGIAGGADKCRYLRDELHVDAAIDYKADDVKAALREHAPKGIDIYFDNVGGDILDAALANLAMNARILLCGGISQYNATAVKGPSNYLALIASRATMTGFLVFDYRARFAEATAEMAGWLAAGKLVAREHVVKGLDTFPATFLKLFSGENVGKLVIEV